MARMHKPSRESQTYQREVSGVGTVEVRRSARRKKTVSAFFENGMMVLAIPALMSVKEEQRWLEHMATKLQDKAVSSEGTPTELQQQAYEIARKYLPELNRNFSIRWVTNQQRRWGSCTTTTGEIRISHRLAPLPQWVQDYVILHELAHLINPNHNADFWALVNRFPEADRAQGFLDGYSYGINMPAPRGDIEDFD